MNYQLAIHGGAGTILKSSMTPELEKAYIAALEEALEVGEKVLEREGTAIEAVEAAVVSMENCPLFNVGKGSVFDHLGKHEMDAAIMDGKSLEAGAVALIDRVKNPVSLARCIMEKSEHVMLAGPAAREFARLHQIEEAGKDYFFSEERFRQWKEAREQDRIQLDHSQQYDTKYGTVGAVALDVHGNLAAATSTGGVTNKKYGRIGDSPIIGAGTYANNATCAVSCTGFGEFFMRAVTAYDISCLIEYKGLSLPDACKEAVQVRLMKIEGDGGVIALDTAGNVCLEFNSEGMYRGWIENGIRKTAIYR
jgi:beta-aspartyl-peptidase (threonine type)